MKFHNNILQKLDKSFHEDKMKGSHSNLYFKQHVAGKFGTGDD